MKGERRRWETLGTEEIRPPPARTNEDTLVTLPPRQTQTVATRGLPSPPTCIRGSLVRASRWQGKVRGEDSFDRRAEGGPVSTRTISTLQRSGWRSVVGPCVTLTNGISSSGES